MRNQKISKALVFLLSISGLVVISAVEPQKANAAFSCYTAPAAPSGTTLTSTLNGVNCEYTYTAGDTTGILLTTGASGFIVPNYVTELKVVVTGSSGSTTTLTSAPTPTMVPTPYTTPVPGGKAAQISATIPVSPGNQFIIKASQRSNAGNCSIGNTLDSYPAGRGGGMAGIWNAAFSVYAGGGGGAGCSSKGAAGIGGDASLTGGTASAGGNPALGTATGGSGGTQLAGGAGGTGGLAGTAGIQYTGGSSGNVAVKAGYGGAGYFGGGGGGTGSWTASSAGGGGGSSRISGTAVLNSESLVDNTLAKVFISYRLPEIPGTMIAPTVTLTGSPSTSYSVAFTPPTNTGSSPITSYTAQLYIDGVAQALKVNGTSSPITVPYQSTPTGNYTFVVYATNSVGSGSVSPESNGFTVPTPPPPTHPPVAPTIGVITTDSTTATVAFTPLTVNDTNTSNLSVSTYTVTAFVNGVATNLKATGSTSPLKVTGLTTGVTYQFNVTATTTAGVSPLNLSGEYTPSLPATPSAPASAPTIATNGTPGQASITFGAVSAPTGSTITSYTFVATGASGNPISVNVATPVSSPYTFSGLSSANSPYTFTYAANNQGGSGAFSTSSASFTVPTVPKAPVLTSVGLRWTPASGTVSFNYTAPADNGGSAITQYRVYVYPSDGSRSPQAANPSSTVETTTINVTNVNTTTYSPTITMQSANGSGWYQYDSVTVTAINAYGESLPSNSLPLIPGQPGGGTVTAIGNTQLTYKVAVPGAATYPDTMTVTAYDQTAASASKLAYDYRRTNSSIPAATAEKDYGSGSGHTYDPPKCVITMPAVSCTISGLINGHIYDFLARGFNASGGGYFGGWVDGSYSPHDISTISPTNLSGTKVSGENAVNLSWNVPLAASSSATATEIAAHVSSYTIIAYASTGETLTATTTNNTTSPSYKFTGLTLGKSYTFVVYATIGSTFTTTSGSPNVTVNSGTSANSPVSNSVLIADVPSTPEAPVVTYGGVNASLEFTAPSNNGSSISSYTFTATPVGGGSTITQTTTDSSSPYVFNGLSASTSYTFTMYATNGQGNSATSAASTNVKSTLSVTPVDISVLEGTSSVSYSFGYTVGGNVVSPNLNNSNWSAPTCGVSPSYSSTTAPGNYSIICSGGNAGTLYDFSYVTGILTVTAKTKLYVVPDSNSILVGSTSTSFTKNYELTPNDLTTSINPATGNTGFVAPTCNISPSYSSSTAVGNYVIICSGGNGGKLYSFDYGYTAVLGVYAAPSFPSAPTNVTVAASGNSGATVSFTAPNIPNPTNVTSYTITATPVGGGSPITVTLSSSSTSGAISGLSPGVSYNIQVAANSASGQSLPGAAYITMASASSGGGVAIGNSPSTPTQVIAVTSVSTGNNYATVSFKPGLNSGLGTTYTVIAYANGVATISATGTSSPIRINGLIPGTAYTFKVIAKNEFGSSNESDPSVTVVIPADSKNSGNGGKVGPSMLLKVYFTNGSSFVDAKPRVEIKKYVAYVFSHKGPYTIEVMGVVEPTKINPIPVPVLAKARAIAVAKLLKAAGLRGKYSIKSGGLTAFRGPKARYAQVVVTWAS